MKKKNYEKKLHFNWTSQANIIRLQSGRVHSRVRHSLYYVIIIYKYSIYNIPSIPLPSNIFFFQFNQSYRHESHMLIQYEPRKLFPLHLRLQQWNPKLFAIVPNCMENAYAIHWYIRNKKESFKWNEFNWIIKMTNMVLPKW